MIHDVVIIGSGFGGLGAAIALRQRGIDDVVILERANDVGGTWRDNVYPGCRCDVASNLYSFSFAPNPSWTNTFSFQPEIWRYLRDIADRFALRALIRFDHEMLGAAFDGELRLWRLTTSHGEYLARCLVLATGGLAEPRLPAISGLDAFAGRVVHTARWDPALDLAGRSVAVIGTGASAVQVVPSVAAQVASLAVFQRTPAWVLPHPGKPVPDSTQRLFRRSPLAQRLAREREYWTRELLVLGFVKDPERMARGEAMALAHLERQVHDPALRERLTPHYRMGCKRVLLSEDYWPTFNLPHVELVTDAIERIEPTGLRTSDGALREVDVVICATGFHVTDNPTAARVQGRDGQRLTDAFAGEHANYRGSTFPRFPNLFMLGGPNTGLGHSSIIFMHESQLRYVTRAVEFALQSRTTLEPTTRAAGAWTRRLRAKLATSVWATGCSSWYLNEAGLNTTIWPDFTFKFRLATRTFKASDHLIESTARP